MAESSKMAQSLPQRPGASKSKHYIYRHPIPIQVLPLPVFHPTNPISLLHIAYVWCCQALKPFQHSIHQGLWSPDTRSVHITNIDSIQSLWTQGFFGKGNLSRSEPNWRKREVLRRGDGNEFVSERATDARREERVKAKWERARIAHAELEQRRIEEQHREQEHSRDTIPASTHRFIAAAPVGPLELLALPNSPCIKGLAVVHETSSSSDSRSSSSTQAPTSSTSDGDSCTTVSTPSGSPNNHHRKSVRFSPTIASASFATPDSPSSTATTAASPALMTSATTKNLPRTSTRLEARVFAGEHLQLAPEEAFFLVFVLGVLKVSDAITKRHISVQDLLSILRRHSYFPPQSIGFELQPDDPFLLDYVLYHNYRSLGWIPRHGLKFGVDWLLYRRGPAFDHAEFGLIVVPSYSAGWWKDTGRSSPKREWQWLMGVQRVLMKVYKSLVLVYIDVPPPHVFDQVLADDGLAAALALYTVKEVMARRFSVNRNR